MPDYSKIFTYEVEGLSYTVSLYEQDGAFLADISVLEGGMDVNALYFGDDEFSGESVSLDGPLNMNGTRLDGEKIQWDDAEALSDPGLGPEGEDKETYVSEGDTLTVELDIESLDEIDVFGIRATSTTTESGSIKAVSDDPEEPEEPIEPTFEKVLFGTDVSDSGEVFDGVFIVDEPREGYEYSLPEGEEPTFENYLTYYEEEVDGYDIPSLDSIVFYSFHEDGYPVEQFRIDAPEGGFQSADEVLEAYDAAIEAGALDPEEVASGDLIAALSLGEEDDTPEDVVEAGDEAEDDLEMI
ncbi:hypothetical protein [Salipiger abyssi]|uniref:Uncharacterized protein n=1 Tax=Salipiger abyssi TaxID=1250539 RepID=A0A1P8UZC5_9RHOB|nr:hypothetical protein [Salipiger abyssi]APZ54731.1 hypothetical protein Ga0080574_TMP4397 [Salipiger abyssi]